MAISGAEPTTDFTDYSAAEAAARHTVASPDTSAGSPALLLFGGPDHKTFLGCLNCSEYSNDSVLNQYSPYGSPYTPNSIFSPYGEFGSAYSTYSACNANAADPPAIVDRNGNYYGRLSINPVNSTHLEYWAAWVSGVCRGH
jgi:hypothetical protein